MSTDENQTRNLMAHYDAALKVAVLGTAAILDRGSRHYGEEMFERLMRKCRDEVEALADVSRELRESLKPKESKGAT